MPRQQTPRAPRHEQTADAIVDAVLGLLESGGYDAVQLREVARRARVSLATIYKLFPTREALVATAVERWMADHCYAELSLPATDETLHEGLMRVFRCVFEPWERNPRMLEAYHRASSGPGGGRLRQQVWDAVAPAGRAVLTGAEPAYLADVERILTDMSYALTGQFADGTLDITEILPTLDRVVYRLTANNEAPAAVSVARRALLADGH
ncbi:MAG TPA: TetR family transcriptional regulator [Yinghuangia sp.]|nr:TetR family transcriptional regulator [Yinghuangia sp.]